MPTTLFQKKTNDERRRDDDVAAASALNTNNSPLENYACPSFHEADEKQAPLLRNTKELIQTQLAGLNNLPRTFSQNLCVAYTDTDGYEISCTPEQALIPNSTSDLKKLYYILENGRLSEQDNTRNTITLRNFSLNTTREAFFKSLYEKIKEQRSSALETLWLHAVTLQEIKGDTSEYKRQGAEKGIALQALILNHIMKTEKVSSLSEKINDGDYFFNGKKQDLTGARGNIFRRLFCCFSTSKTQKLVRELENETKNNLKR